MALSTAFNQRFEVRARQRGRDGFKPLAGNAAPTVADMIIDRIELSVTGTFGPRVPMENAGELLTAYREMLLLARGCEATARWLAPQQRSRVRFRMPLAQSSASTISHAVVRANWTPDRVELSLRIVANPTRTLVHCLPRLSGRSDPLSVLRSMPPRLFFAPSEAPACAQSLDGEDNVLGSLRDLQERIGPDFFTPFLAVYEEKLRSWAVDALAPASLGFRALPVTNGIVARRGQDVVHLAWPMLKVWSAEAYFERRHGSAQALLDRLSDIVASHHARAEWRLYGENDLGGVRAGSKVIGIEPTQAVQLKYYAKTASRVRAEIRYTKKVRNTVRETNTEENALPLQNLLSAVRRDAVARSRWSVFYAMCTEPSRPMLVEAAQLMTAIVDAARRSNVPPAPVLATLLGAGSIEESASDGGAPRRLMRRLEAAGVISRASLARLRPGDTRRHGLAAHWTDTAERLRAAFREIPLE